MRRTLAFGLLSLTLAGCGPLTSAARTTGTPTTSASRTTATVALRTTPTPTATTAPVDLQPPAVSYVGLVSYAKGPVVPVTVQRGKFVSLPGSRQIRLNVSRDFGACDTFLSASASGRWVAYTTPAGDLHVIDTRARNEYSLGTGCDPTWGPGDRLAYVMAGTVSLETNTYRSVAVVRQTPLGTAKVWASGELWGLAWAGDRLLYSKTRATFPHSRVLVASHPGAARVVPAGAAGNESPLLLIAVSPDAKRLLVQVTRSVHGVFRTYEDLVDSTSLKVLDELSPKGFQGLGDAVWVGDRVVAAQGGAYGGSAHPQPELVRLATNGDKLRVLQVRNEHPGDGALDALSDLQAFGSDRVAVTHYQRTNQLLSCRISTLACTVVLDLG